MMEEQYTANWFSKPGDSIRAIMHRKQITAQQVAEELDGGILLLRSLLDGSKEIDEPVAKNLSLVLGATPHFWLTRQKNFEKAIARSIASIRPEDTHDLITKIPVPGAKISFKMTDARRAEEIRRRLVYFGVSNFKVWQQRYGGLIDSTAFRSTQAYEMREEAVLMWLRRGEIEADLIDTKPWEPGNLLDRLEAIKKLSLQKLPKLFLPKLRTLLAEAGVALVVVKSPQGCRASGATRLIAPDKAMLLMSFRHRSDDHFWFTMFHEIGHLVLHQAHTFVEGEMAAYDHREDEANDFARRCIIPDDRTSEFEELLPEKMPVLRFSASLRIAPGLTVGQMQKWRKIGPEKLNYLKRRWTWDQIDAVSV
ncbi:ImmA/IrrE family metallo-endopeptidase [Pseudochelatococcus sp. G4_1912]|uniref:ImmA/IrrE family metallo-endopeptidase n=1 Tax=Pseudochelatococcus sp. G4_1912 TaxID=3114288 RepID=UPI0039C74C58